MGIDGTNLEEVRFWTERVWFDSMAIVKFCAVMFMGFGSELTASSTVFRIGRIDMLNSSTLSV